MDTMTNQTSTSNPIQRNINEFNGLDSQRKAMVIGLIAILFIVSIVVGSMVTRKGTDMAAKTNTEQGQQATGGNQQAAATTSLSISPAETSLSVGKTQEFEVKLADVPVAATDIVIAFDPEVLDVSGLKNGTAFPKLIRNKIEEGKIVYSASVDPSNPDKTAQGVVFTFSAKAKKATKSTALEFTQGETITALNGDNTLGVTNGAIIMVK